MLQNVVVIQDAGVTKVVTELTHDVFYASEQASEAIQQALDAVAGGGVVTLGRGTFELGAPVALREQVWLRGSGRGTKVRVKGPTGLLGEGVKGVVISDLALVGGNPEGGSGLVLDAAVDCKVRDVVALGFADYGVWVRNNSLLCEVRGCSLAGNRRANLYFDHMERGAYGDFIPNLVANCLIYGGGKGIDVNRTIVLNIVGCVVYQTKDIAYHVRNTSNSVLISGCRSFQITGHAVAVEDSHEFNLSSNIFCWHTGHGVWVKDCNWGTITGNEIIDSGSYNSGAPDLTTKVSEIVEPIPLYNGIDLTNVKGYSITGNAIFNWPVVPRIGIGIREDAGCVRNTIVSNSINYYEQADVCSEGQASVVASNVSFRDSPYQSPEAVGTALQSFVTGLTDDCIAELMATDEEGSSR